MLQAVPVDLPVRDDTDDDLLGTSQDRAEELSAPFRRHLLRVVQQPERPHLVVAQTAVVEQDAGHHQRPRQRAATGLVRAGDEPRAQLAVVPKELLAGAQRHGRENS